MKESDFQKCPICEQDVKSDASFKYYCKLCGMIAEDEKEFCCESCDSMFRMISRRV